jgi:hypothetical protein
MCYPKLLQQMIGMTLVLLLLVGCGASAATPVPPTITPVPPTATPIPLSVTTEPTCGTVVTMIEEGPPAKFGETKIEIELVDYYYDGIVAGGGFAEPRNGGIEEVRIGGEKVTLTRNDFSEGYIHTDEFGMIKVLFTANVLQECALLIATPEQVTQISDWLR